jgi:hypothetical protein
LHADVHPNEKFMVAVKDRTTGALLQEVSYHLRDYFLKQWDRF